ncbi:MAG: hypothetical protein HZB82_08670 [Deltaproteobacteria bacterium]|nr:hypothetical protein [Deltaproteobacteria bacterium]
MKIRFYSYFGALQVMSVFLSGAGKEIYYFDISAAGKALLGLLNMKGRVKPFEFILAEVKDSTGQSYFPRIYGRDIVAVCDVIENDVFRKNPLIDALGNIFDREKIILYFRKIAGKEIAENIAFLNVISWHCQTVSGNKPDAVEFFIESTAYYRALRDFALREHRISLGWQVSSRKMFRFFYPLIGNVFLSVLLCFRPLASFFSTTKKLPSDKSRPVLASLYTVRGLTFDRTKRCDFPWLLMSEMSREQILIYFDRKDLPVTDDMAELLRRQGVNCMAMSAEATSVSGMPVFVPSFVTVKKLLRQTGRVLFAAFKEASRLRLRSLVYLSAGIRFAREYSVAYDFYLSNNIKINMDFIDFDPNRIPRSLALRDAGGVSISYQVSNWPIPNVILGTGADIFFMFGPHYLKNFLKGGACNDAVVYTGYTSDYSFAAVKERARDLRERLVGSGAQFVVAYFDENSAGGRMSIIPHKTAAVIYKRLLELVVADGTIGLICSPKRPKTLLKRMPELSSLLKKAKDTGRCLFIEGEYATDKYPAESAQASDLVITLLIGGTTALESHLCGQRAVFLDLEGFYSYTEYEWGRNTIVFDDMDALISAIERFRQDGQANDALGNPALIRTLNEKDPFRDGKAAERMGQYLNWLLEAFNQGGTRQDAIASANSKYAEQWGKENIVRLEYPAGSRLSPDKD